MAALTGAKAFHAVNAAMKRRALSRQTAPTPRLTLWVPVLAALGLCLLWLALLALVQR
jgi:hypothetical protein